MSNYHYNSISMAKHLAFVYRKYNYKYNNTKLQKLLYACYGSILVLKDNAELIDEKPKILPFGPVFSKVLEYIKLNPNFTPEPLLNIEKDVDSIVNQIVKQYGKYSAMSLTNWSHKKGSPWYVMFIEKNCQFSTEIPNELMIQYFSKYVNKD